MLLQGHIETGIPLRQDSLALHDLILDCQLNKHHLRTVHLIDGCAVRAKLVHHRADISTIAIVEGIPCHLCCLVVCFLPGLWAFDRGLVDLLNTHDCSFVITVRIHAPHGNLVRELAGGHHVWVRLRRHLFCREPRDDLLAGLRLCDLSILTTQNDIVLTNHPVKDLANLRCQLDVQLFQVLVGLDHPLFELAEDRAQAGDGEVAGHHILFTGLCHLFMRGDPPLVFVRTLRPCLERSPFLHRLHTQVVEHLANVCNDVWWRVWTLRDLDHVVEEEVPPLMDGSAGVRRLQEPYGQTLRIIESTVALAQGL